MNNTYRIGHQYSDAGKIGAGDEFMDALNVDDCDDLLASLDADASTMPGGEEWHESNWATAL